MSAFEWLLCVVIVCGSIVVVVIVGALENVSRKLDRIIELLDDEDDDPDFHEYEDEELKAA